MSTTVVIAKEIRWLGVLIASLALIWLGRAEAKPTVEGYDLVSTSRVSRTVFDYSYRLRVQGDLSTYSDAAISISLKAGPSTTTIVQGVVSIGDLPAGDFIRPQGLFVVRHDRAVPFDPSRLVFDFSGSPIVGNGNGSPVEIGKISMMEEGGRAGHGGTFPILGAPHADRVLSLVADVFDSPNTVAYRLLAGDGATLLAQDVMERTSGGSSRYFKTITVPRQPFKIEIVATAADGKQSRRLTSLIRPTLFEFQITNASAMVRPGQRVLMSFSLSTSEAAGRYVVTALAPLGTTLTPSSWTVDVNPGAPRAFSGNLDVALTAPKLNRQRIVFTVAPASAPSEARDYAQWIIVY